MGQTGGVCLMTRRFFSDDSMIVAGPALNRAPRAADLARLKSFRIGPVEIRPSTREVIQGDRCEVLEPRVMQVLVVLADARGEILSRDDLIAACWQGRAVTDHSINRVILRLRALGRRFPSFEIETIIKVGYRLVEKDEPAPPARSAANSERRPAQHRRLLTAGIACAAIAALIGAWHFAGLPVPGIARVTVLPLDLSGAGANRRIDGKAYALYLQARPLLRGRRQTDMARAEELLQGAVTVQPDFAAAWANLSIATMLGQVYNSDDSAARASAQADAGRAVALDPKLAEGWAAKALANQLTGDAAEADIHRALSLRPGDSGILLWASMTEENQGDYAKACRHARAAADIDPLWERTAEAGAECALIDGLSADVQAYVDRLRSVDPDGAALLQARLALGRGDFSKVVSIGLGDPARMARTNRLGATTAMALLFLGQSNAGAALLGMTPIDRGLVNHRLPAPAALRKRMRELTSLPGEGEFYAMIFSELAAANRWSEIARFYDEGLGPFADIRSGTAFAQDRMRFESLAALALARAGRSAEARQLQQQSDAAADRLRTNGLSLPADIWFELAQVDAAQGRHERALEELAHAYDHAGLGGFTGYPDITLDPFLGNLRGDPRFARYCDLVRARLEQQRREMQSLHVL
jgi:DNA-binding winged helix-turn-helix (wHTH) protein/tetratricopeptide (TPR) repeat protein